MASRRQQPSRSPSSTRPESAHTGVPTPQSPEENNRKSEDTDSPQAGPDLHSSPQPEPTRALLYLNPDVVHKQLDMTCGLADPQDPKQAFSSHADSLDPRPGRVDAEVFESPAEASVCRYPTQRRETGLEAVSQEETWHRMTWFQIQRHNRRSEDTNSVETERYPEPGVFTGELMQDAAGPTSSDQGDSDLSYDASQSHRRHSVACPTVTPRTRRIGSAVHADVDYLPSAAISATDVDDNANYLRRHSSPSSLATEFAAAAGYVFLVQPAALHHNVHTTSAADHGPAAVLHNDNTTTAEDHGPAAVPNNVLATPAAEHGHLAGSGAEAASGNCDPGVSTFGADVDSQPSTSAPRADDLVVSSYCPAASSSRSQPKLHRPRLMDEEKFPRAACQSVQAHTAIVQLNLPSSLEAYPGLSGPKPAIGVSRTTDSEHLHSYYAATRERAGEHPLRRVLSSAITTAPQTLHLTLLGMTMSEELLRQWTETLQGTVAGEVGRGDVEVSHGIEGLLNQLMDTQRELHLQVTQLKDILDPESLKTQSSSLANEMPPEKSRAGTQGTLRVSTPKVHSDQQVLKGIEQALSEPDPKPKEPGTPEPEPKEPEPPEPEPKPAPGGCCCPGLRRDWQHADGRRRWVRTLWMAACLIPVGSSVSQRGSAFLDLQLITNTRLEHATFYYSSFGAGSVCGCLVYGMIYSRVKGTLLLLLPNLCSALATLALPWCTTFSSMLAINFILGIFISFLVTATNSEVMHTWRMKAEVPMQLINFAYSAGGVLGPLYTQPFLARWEDIEPGTKVTTVPVLDPLDLESAVLSTNASQIAPSMEAVDDPQLRPAFALTAGMMLLCCLPFCWELLRDRRPKEEDAREGSLTERNEEPKFQVTRRRSSSLRFYTALSGICLFFFMYVGLESTITGLLATFLVKHLGWSNGSAASTLSLFWSTFAGSRLLFMFFSGRVKTSAVLLGSAVGILSAVLVLLPTVLLPPSAMRSAGVLIVVGILGFFMAPVFPLGFTWMQENLLDVTGKVTSVTLVAATLSNATFSALVGYLMDCLSLLWYVYLMLGVSVFFLLLYLLLLVVARRWRSRHSVFCLELPNPQ